ncbi:MAG: [FeFe] hydrogenase H-cluster radical SAM maturase HydG [Deltaproteobacteria bacterium]|nr:[FeFe] hydrogenase H-cluster radical SAM maturase HydG [Deltaproteobacteria bacterium]
MKKIINADLIEKLIDREDLPSKVEVLAALERAKELKGIGLEETALLMRAGRAGVCLDEIYQASGEVKRKSFGSRIVLFAPLYLTNDCINNCLYCGFRKDNIEVDRNSLSVEDAIREASLLEKTGFNRLLLVAGESPKSSSIERIVEIVKAIYQNTGMRIIHVNAAPMPIDKLKALKASGVGVFQVFQETYHEETYDKMHTTGPKKDYRRRLYALDKAMEAGFDDVGMGALLGLYDWRYEVLALIAHARHLFEKFGAWPHTISVPRLQPTVGSPIASAPHPVSDEEFKLIVALYRLAVPAAGVVVTTREPAVLRDELLHIGVSQISAGSRTDPGGYSQDAERFDASQFKTSDHRSLEEMVAYIASTGHLPSLCTSCYRVGRTGRSFTETVSHQEMERYCLPNALLTLKEYVIDHANGSAAICNEVIERNVSLISDEKLKKATLAKFKEIDAGKRDLYF